MEPQAARTQSFSLPAAVCHLRLRVRGPHRCSAAALSALWESERTIQIRTHLRRLLKYWSGSRCCGFWRWPRREAQCRYPQRSRPSKQRRPTPKSTQPSTALGRRAAGGVARSLQPTKGDAPPSLLAIRPSASTRDPFQYFNSLLAGHSCQATESPTALPRPYT